MDALLLFVVLLLVLIAVGGGVWLSPLIWLVIILAVIVALVGLGAGHPGYYRRRP